MTTLKHFIFIHNTLYFKGAGGILSRCISNDEAGRKLQEFHDIWCSEDGPPLYRRIQRAGYYWPSMAKDASQLQVSCLSCLLMLDEAECKFVASTRDWRRSYMNFLKNNVLPTDSRDAKMIKRKVKKYILQGDELYRISF